MKKKARSHGKEIFFDLFNNKMMEIGKQNNINNSIKKTEAEKVIPVQKYEIDLMKIMKEYHPVDVFKAILIAESWVPNINHFIKFALLFEIFFTISKEDFIGKRIENYKEFSVFLAKIFRILPYNSMVEDFYPVGDWGEVKYQLEEKSYKILYGSPLSDNYGFLKGFEISYLNNTQAMEDFKQILEIQNSLISTVNIQIENNNEGNKLEIPSIAFWEKMLDWIDSFNIKNVNDKLVVENGEPRKNKDFYERYLEADVNPYFYYRYNGAIYPFSLRNYIAVIVEHYYIKGKVSSEITSLNISNFLKDNIPNLLCGSFKVRNKSKVLPYNFCGFFQSENNTYFINCLSVDELSNIQSIKNNLKKIMSASDWGIQKIYSPLGLKPRDVDGSDLSFNKIKFIFVLSDLTTLPKILDVKFEENIKFITIYDFVSIIDSLQSKEDLDGFINFHNLYASKTLFLGFNLDGYASYQASFGLLEDGALNFNLIHTDTHSAHYFKYESLKEMYSDLINYLPSSDSKWISKSVYDDNYCFLAKDYSSLVWSSLIDKYVIHFLFDFRIVDRHIVELNPKVLELFCEAAADAFSQRKSVLSTLILKKNIVFQIKVGNIIQENSDFLNNDFYIKDEVFKNNIDCLVINIYLDLNYCFHKFQLSVDAEFQTEICIKMLKIINKYSKIESLSFITSKLNETINWPLRMTMGHVKTRFDIVEKKPRNVIEYKFKLARQKIAFILKNNDIQPNKYTDKDLAKSIINSAADELREYIHNIIKNRNTLSVLEIILDDYSALVTDNYINFLRQEQSLKHQVSYNRAERLAELDFDFKRNSQNHRYLIECTLMLANDNTQPITEDEFLDLLAHIHWLLNLYHSSDGLHFGIGVEGIDVDNTYIPEIYIPESTSELENKFHEELSSYKLGIGLNSEDELESIIPKDGYKLINEAFYQDLGFGFKNLFTVLYSLSNWSNIKGINPQTYYKAEFEELVQLIFKNFTVEDVTLNEVEKIIQFLIIENDKINQLEGVADRHYDVPVSDHSKRTNRINIKPLIKLNNTIIWSPACSYRSLGIWTNHTTDGYLPADFNFPKVKDLVLKSKTYLEKQLETKAFDVLSRRTNYIKHGIDLKKTFFKEEQYPDIGDYDVLAYFPDSNKWVMVECKYNQPAYCLKDMSRLRGKIFGKDQLDTKSHISKVRGRYDFLLTDYDRIRKSLKWPQPLAGKKIEIINLYISKNTYWWFRFPPYEVDLNFVQIDFLDQWLKDNFDAQALVTQT
ncbi:hypothetical protein [Acinetobacter guillouiae]|uniref:hypothetical protein n=1 Tax=Acinetobacter guillouiae TaxID=106649 RepID=UPI001AE90EE2|nr:hypothetical protein [Acinetobacter guillouiae]MBP2544475.1 hypothetical protein [Acinetobacter guillouiae]